MDAGSLLTASLTRDQDAIRTGATHRGLAPDLSWLVAELAVGPYAHALQRALSPDSEDDSAARRAARAGRTDTARRADRGRRWLKSSSSHRLLRCSFCAAAWEMSNLRVRLLRARRAKRSSPRRRDQERIDRRVEVCGSCARVSEDRRSFPSVSPFPLVAIADLETMDLDAAAMEHNYSPSAR